MKCVLNQLRAHKDCTGISIGYYKINKTMVSETQLKVETK